VGLTAQVNHLSERDSQHPSRLHRQNPKCDAELVNPLWLNEAHQVDNWLTNKTKKWTYELRASNQRPMDQVLQVLSVDPLDLNQLLAVAALERTSLLKPNNSLGYIYIEFNDALDALGVWKTRRWTP
jgi:hypothetical protein